MTTVSQPWKSLLRTQFLRLHGTQVGVCFSGSKTKKRKTVLFGGGQVSKPQTSIEMLRFEIYTKIDWNWNRCMLETYKTYLGCNGSKCGLVVIFRKRQREMVQVCGHFLLLSETGNGLLFRVVRSHYASKRFKTDCFRIIWDSANREMEKRDVFLKLGISSPKNHSPKYRRSSEASVTEPIYRSSQNL